MHDIFSEPIGFGYLEEAWDKQPNTWYTVPDTIGATVQKKLFREVKLFKHFLKIWHANTLVFHQSCRAQHPSLLPLDHEAWILLQDDVVTILDTATGSGWRSLNRFEFQRLVRWHWNPPGVLKRCWRCDYMITFFHLVAGYVTILSHCHQILGLPQA